MNQPPRPPSRFGAILRDVDPLTRVVNERTELVRLTGVHSFRHACKADAGRVQEKDLLLHRTHADGYGCAHCPKCNTLFVSSERGDPVEDFRRGG